MIMKGHRRGSSAPVARRRAKTAPALPGEVRIIAGQWRGRRLRFPAVPGIRPTPDRVRETLFNWLASWVPASRCLDLFAGSGALGLEALSRGAAEVVFVDRSTAVARHLRATLERLGERRGTVIVAEALRYLRGASRPFDVVFLDPPFDEDVLSQACEALYAGGWLAGDARVYLEAPRSRGVPALPPGWELLRTGSAGQVGYHLARPPGRTAPTVGPGHNKPEPEARGPA